MYAIVEIAGQQFKVVKDQKVFVHRLATEEGKAVSFDNVLLIGDGDNVTLGAPAIDGAQVGAKVLMHLKGDKVIVFKKKRRKGYRKKNGHRQALSEIIIESIVASGAKKATKAESKETKKAAKAESEGAKKATKAESQVTKKAAKVESEGAEQATKAQSKSAKKVAKVENKGTKKATPTKAKKSTTAKAEKAVPVKEAKKAVAKPVAKKQEATQDLSSLTVAELREMAKAKEISGYSSMKKAELIAALS